MSSCNFDISLFFVSSVSFSLFIFLFNICISFLYLSFSFLNFKFKFFNSSFNRFKLLISILFFSIISLLLLLLFEAIFFSSSLILSLNSILFFFSFSKFFFVFSNVSLSKLYCEWESSNKFSNSFFSSEILFISPSKELISSSNSINFSKCLLFSSINSLLFISIGFWKEIIWLFNISFFFFKLFNSLIVGKDNIVCCNSIFSSRSLLFSFVFCSNFLLSSDKSLSSREIFINSFFNKSTSFCIFIFDFFNSSFSFFKFSIIIFLSSFLLSSFLLSSFLLSSFLLLSFLILSFLLSSFLLSSFLISSFLISSFLISSFLLSSFLKLGVWFSIFSFLFSFPSSSFFCNKFNFSIKVSFWWLKILFSVSKFFIFSSKLIFSFPLLSLGTSKGLIPMFLIWFCKFNISLFLFSNSSFKDWISFSFSCSIFFLFFLTFFFFLIGWFSIFSSWFCIY